MAFFPLIATDRLVFAGEKTRLSCIKSFVSDGTEAPLKIKPSEDQPQFISITDTKQLDWVYATPGEKVITVEMGEGDDAVQITHTVTVLNASALKLFSTDDDLIPYEPEILSYLPDKWSTFNIVHKVVQDRILDALDKAKIWKNGVKLTADDIANVDEVRAWAAAMAMQFIYEGSSNQVGDVFAQK
ncbi:MAG: hypothetical protein J7501_03840, partial [Bdellovibrio sp.]|nr:hypothetical protein [Bdellovibrio sp.]